MAASHTKLTARQQKALALLLSSPSVAAAAKTGQMSQRTLFRFLQVPHFVQAYEAARHEQVNNALMNLERIAQVATEVLHEIMVNSWTRPSARVMACRTILSIVLKNSDVDEEEEGLVVRPPVPPAYDLSLLSSEEWEQLKKLREKMRVA